MNGSSKKKRISGITHAYEDHLRALKRFVARILRSQQDVEDIVQEAFSRAYSAEINKPINDPKPYLFRTAKNVALNYVRRRSIRVTDYLEDIAPDDYWQGDRGDTLEDEILAQEKLEIHFAAIAALPAQCRKVYLMRKVYGMTYTEISKELSITVSTVKSHLEKAFSRCQEYMESRLGDQGSAQKYRVRDRGPSL